MKLTAEEIATAVQAQRLDAAASIVPFGYSIDSRTLAAGECFIAIQGPNFDGHEFIGAALKQGAALVIARADTKSLDRARLARDSGRRHVGRLAAAG